MQVSQKAEKLIADLVILRRMKPGIEYIQDSYIRCDNCRRNKYLEIFPDKSVECERCFATRIRNKLYNINKESNHVNQTRRTH